LKSFIILKNINYIRCYTSWPLFGQKVVWEKKGIVPYFQGH
jgi:hypothetical protein